MRNKLQEFETYKKEVKTIPIFANPKYSQSTEEKSFQMRLT